VRRLVWLLAWAVAACGPPDPTPGPSHVVLVSIDTLRADHLGAYGYDRPTSPHLDALASEGTLFWNASSTSPWTLPAHASLLTGRWPSRHGVRSEAHRIPGDVPLLAELLRRQGWATAAVVNSRYLGRRFGFDRGFDHFQALPAPRSTEASGVEAAALDWLERHADAERFFLFVHFYDVHSDYGATPELEARFGVEGPGLEGRTEELRAVRRGERALSGDDLRRLRGLYDAGIARVDAAVGRLVAALDRHGLRDSTWVVVTADHGEEFLEHGGVLHGRTHYREVLRVPLVFAGPGVVRGRRIDAPVSVADVAPTLLGALGHPAPAGMDGVDLSPWLRGGSPEPDGPRFVLAEGDHGDAEPDSLRSLRGPRLELIRDGATGRSELYDWRADPAQRRDRAADWPEERARLERQLEVLSGSARAAEPRPPLSEEEAAELRALGYLR
jgi:arylsulfatase A-like enzyme